MLNVLLQSETEQEELEINSEKIAEKSPYYKTLFSAKFSEGVTGNIVLNWKNVPLVKHILQFLEEKINLDFEKFDVIDVLDLGDYWQCLEHLKLFCVEYIEQNCDNDNYEFWLEGCVKYELEIDKLDFTKVQVFKVVDALKRHGGSYISLSLSEACEEEIKTNWYKYPLEQVAKYLIEEDTDDLYLNLEKHSDSILQLLQHTDDTPIHSALLDRVEIQCEDHNIEPADITVYYNLLVYLIDHDHDEVREELCFNKEIYEKLNYTELNFDIFRYAGFEAEDSYYSTYEKCEHCDYNGDRKINKEIFNTCILYMLKNPQMAIMRKLITYIKQASAYTDLTFKTIRKILQQFEDEEEVCTFFVNCIIKKDPEVYKLFCCK